MRNDLGEGSVLLGDAGNAATNYMLTPLAHANIRPEKNKAHIEARNCSERFLGHGKYVFRY